MFNYLAMAYKDFDYTIMITVVFWSRCILLVLKFTLVLELCVCSCLPIGHQCLGTHFNFHWQYSSQEGRPTKFWPHCRECPMCTDA